VPDVFVVVVVNPVEEAFTVTVVAAMPVKHRNKRAIEEKRDFIKKI